MRIPHVICENTIKAYETPNIFIRTEQLKSDDYEWIDGTIERLRMLCLLTIAKHWEKYPLYNELEVPKDKSEILELIATNIPLELTVPIIQEEYYWERCYEAYWPDSAPPNRRYKYEKLVPYVAEEEFDSTEEIKYYEKNDSLSTFEILKSVNTGDDYSIRDKYFLDKEFKKSVTSTTASSPMNIPNNVIVIKSWKQNFIERYVAGVLEHMTPDIFHTEYIKELTSLHKDYILSLNLTQLQSCKNEDNCDHISLQTLLSDLPNLIEFSVCFNQGNLEDEFKWHYLKVSENDCIYLGKGMKQSNLQILRVIHSSVDCKKAKLLVRNLEEHPTLRILDFSHCNISDDGALAIAGVLMKNPTIDTLILKNNKIGERGAQGFGYYLCQPESRLLKLNLKLNPLGVQGGRYIATGLARAAKTLNHLSLSACGLTSENFPFGIALGLNDTLLTLDLSNNRLGEVPGNMLLEKLKVNTSLIRIDLRLCDIPPDIVQEINILVQNNLKKYRGVALKTPPYTEEII